MKISIHDLWEIGVRLNRAPYAFSPKSEKLEYDRLHGTSTIEALVSAAERANETGLTGWDALNASLATVRPMTSARSDWNERMRKLIHHHLLHENLFGYGFEPPRTMESQPFKIPKACWNGHIRWDNDTLSSDGLEFVHVRLLSEEARSKFLAEKSETTTSVRAGRPSIKEHVQEAFDALAAIGLIDTSAAARKHFEPIRDWLRTNKPDAGYTDGIPSNEGIRAHFAPLFNELRKNRKQ
jgi:hypothetical protein